MTYASICHSFCDFFFESLPAIKPSSPLKGKIAHSGRFFCFYYAYLFEPEIWSDSLDVLTRQFRKVFEVIDGSEFDLFPAKRVDRLRLMVTQIGMPLKPVDGTGVDIDLLNGCTVCGEMRQQGIQMTSGKGSIG